MKECLTILLLLAYTHNSLLACSSYARGSGNSRTILKSFDFDTDHGFAMINYRGVRKKGLEIYPTDDSPTWISQYASISFNQAG